MELENELTLNLIKEDFKDTDFRNPCACVISKAYKRVFGGEPYESLNDLIDYETEITYKHDWYGLALFKQDKVKVNQAKDGEVIRVIKLTRVN